LFTLPPSAEPVRRVMRFVIQVFHGFLVAPCVQVHQVVNFVGDVVVDLLNIDIGFCQLLFLAIVGVVYKPMSGAKYIKCIGHTVCQNGGF